MRHAIKSQSFFFSDADDIPTLAIDIGRGTGDCDGGLLYVCGDATSDIARCELLDGTDNVSYLINANGHPLEHEPYNIPATMLRALHCGDVAGAIAGVHINLAPATDVEPQCYTVTISYQAGSY